MKRSLVAGLVLLSAAVLLGCQDPVDPRTAGLSQSQPGQLELPENVDEVVVELSYEGGMIANPDPTPFVRVYSDRRVRVHYPAYMKRAGTYEVQLDEAEFEDLLASFSDEGVLQLDEGDLLTMSRELQAEGLAEMSDGHGERSVVRIRGESFTPEDAEEPSLFAIDHTISTPNLVLEAAPTAAFPRLRSLADGVSRLEAIARRDTLQPIEEQE